MSAKSLGAMYPATHLTLATIVFPPPPQNRHRPFLSFLLPGISTTVPTKKAARPTTIEFVLAIVLRTC